MKKIFAFAPGRHDLRQRQVRLKTVAYAKVNCLVASSDVTVIANRVTSPVLVVDMSVRTIQAGALAQCIGLAERPLGRILIQTALVILADIRSENRTGAKRHCDAKQQIPAVQGNGW